MIFTTKNGFMTLKVVLPATEISRTIVVPECMTLTDLNDAIQCVMGWEDAHLWRFQEGREGPTYERPHEDEFVPFLKRLRFDSDKVTLGRAFPKKGAKLTYIYDFGDDWTHIVTRMADPKIAEIACTKTKGPDGVEDFGGQWQLGAFIADMQKNPDNEDWAELADWAKFDTKKRLLAYLKGPSAEVKTAILKDVLSHVKIEVPIEGERPEPMSDEESAYLLGMIFATSVSRGIWQILEDALSHGGECEFYDNYDTITPYLLRDFDCLKIQKGGKVGFYKAPNTLVVPNQWVEWYEKSSEMWKTLRRTFDILEAYVLAAVHLYGVVKSDDLYEIICRYDPDIRMKKSDVIGYLQVKARWEGIGYRFEYDMFIDDMTFPTKAENVKEDILDLIGMQGDYPRWYPATREELFNWVSLAEFKRTLESEEVGRVLHSIKRTSPEEVAEILETIYALIVGGLSPKDICKSLETVGLIGTLSEAHCQSLIAALEKWKDTIHIQCLNGNTIRALRKDK